MMNMIDLVEIHVETLNINIGYSLEKEFIELIGINRSLLLYLSIY